MVEAHKRRRAAKPGSARIKVDHEGKTARIGPDHPDVTTGTVRLMDAIGTDSFEFLDGFLSQLTNAATHGGKLDERGTNFMLSVVEDVGPRDQIEAMLAAQMAAVHMASMAFARRLAHVENIAQQDSAERAFNKLARTFTAQIEALRRYRTGGHQKVTVEHVHVHAGGQAIVGSVEQGGGVARQDESHARTITHAPQPPLWRNDEKREAVPVSSDAEREVSDARGSVPGSAER